MSGAAEAVVVSQSAFPMLGTTFASAMMPLAIGVGGAVALYGAGRLAYMAAQHLESEYQGAMSDFRARTEAEVAGLRIAQQRQQVQAQHAVRTVASASTKAEVDANAEFLRASLRRARGRLGEGSDVPPDLPAQMAVLENEIQNGASNLAQVWKELEKLQAQVSAINVQRVARQTEAATRPDEKKAAQIAHMQEELALLRAEFDSPLWQRGEGVAEQARLSARLNSLEGLLETQPASVAQGIVLLQSAVARSRDLLAANEDARRRKIAEKATLVREFSGAITARGQALSSLDDNAASQIGVSLLAKLSVILARSRDSELDELRSLATEAETHFAATQKRLSDAAMAAFVQLQVADVLSELGYRVQTVEGDEQPTSLLAVLDSENGVQIHVGGDGQLQSELVAFGAGEGEVPADRWAQERACNLVDQIYDGLRQRKLEVKERKRKTLRSGDSVRRMARDNNKEETLIASAPKALTLD
ncbi:hypothetical protein EON83_12740 [bacterium]|nr:MAG: hypothetical protein EON83_12740 [bacterium]